jgi:hypothetical protein
MASDESQRNGDTPDTTPLALLRAQLLQRWRSFPEDKSKQLDVELQKALERAAGSEAELVTVMNPVSRPQRLRLAVLVTDADLDTMYQREWGELAVSDTGRCYLIYRRREDGDYAIEWSPATTIPTTMMNRLSGPLASALLESDGDNES